MGRGGGRDVKFVHIVYNVNVARSEIVKNPWFLTNLHSLNTYRLLMYGKVALEINILIFIHILEPSSSFRFTPPPPPALPPSICT
jgi:hypothetical protein